MKSTIFQGEATVHRVDEPIFSEDFVSIMCEDTAFTSSSKSLS